MNRELLEKLDDARHYANTPFVITSSYRKGDEGSHGDGDAVDIRCHESRPRFMIVSGLIHAGFTRIGIYDKHIHADVSSRLDQIVMWWGVSE